MVLMLLTSSEVELKRRDKERRDKLPPSLFRVQRNSADDSEEQDSDATMKCCNRSKRRSCSRSVKVRFDCVEIVEFAYCIGHNPAVRGGVPLSMTMDPINIGIVPLEEYENQRQGFRSHGADLIIGTEARQQM